MKNLNDYLIESVDNSNTINKKIYKAFGFQKKDKFTDTIDKWVKDNNVENVSFFVKDKEALDDLEMPKSIKSLYSDGKDTLNKINTSLEKNKIEFIKDGDESWNTFRMSGNDFVLSFSSGSGPSLFVIKK